MSKAKPGPKTGPLGPRVGLWWRGPAVDPETKTTFELWRDMYGVPYGRIIDAMLSHVKEDPNFRIPTRGRKTYRQKPKLNQ